MSPLARGLVNMELHRGDGSLGTFLGVQSGLAMKSIALLGSEEQKERWLPGDGAAGRDRRLRADRARRTAPTPSRSRRRARRDGDGWVLDGAKRWIGNGSIADVVVVWARDDEDGQVKGFLVETAQPGYNGDDDRRQGRGARDLAGADHARRRPRRRDGCPARTRSRTPAACSSPRAATCAWAALGHAVAAYDTALTYAKQRDAVRQAAARASRSSRTGS